MLAGIGADITARNYLRQEAGALATPGAYARPQYSSSETLRIKIIHLMVMNARRRTNFAFESFELSMALATSVITDNPLLYTGLASLGSPLLLLFVVDKKIMHVQ